MDLTDKNLEHALALLANTEEYSSYSQALRTADNATPYEIPKADGKLKFAQEQLRQLIIQSGFNPTHIPALMQAIKAQLRR